MLIEEKIRQLPAKTQRHIWEKYEDKELNMGTGWFLGIIGRHLGHTNKRGLQILYIILGMIPYLCLITFVRWIVNLVNLKDNINKRNREILEDIYLRYKNI